MHAQNLLATLQVRSSNANLTVETARAQQRWVEDVWAVGCRDQDDVGLRIETIHFNQKLVEGLLALIVASTDTGTAVTTDGVDLVDEDDCGCALLGLLEEVAHT